jgi:hypothetical protein
MRRLMRWYLSITPTAGVSSGDVEGEIICSQSNKTDKPEERSAGHQQIQSEPECSQAHDGHG